MKKALAFLAIFAITSSALTAQSFLHGAGVGFTVTEAKAAKTNVFFTLTYFPRVNFIETETLSVSAGIPMVVGLSGTYSAQYSSYGSYEENTLQAMVQLPLIINLNGGAGSTKENEQRVGYFIGGGFGYYYGGVGYKKDEWGNETDERATAKSVGPAANAGLRFAVGSHQKNIEARLSYMKGINDYKPSIFGLTAAFNF